MRRSRIYRLMLGGALAAERPPKTGRYLVGDDPERVAGLRRRLAANDRT